MAVATDRDERTSGRVVIGGVRVGTKRARQRGADAGPYELGLSERLPAVHRGQAVHLSRRLFPVRAEAFGDISTFDHRIGYTSHQMQNVLGGELDGFIDALLQEEQARKLAAVGG